MTLKCLYIKIKGIVQGVGFRPYIYRLAENLNLKGWIRNDSEGVTIEIEGQQEPLKKFVYTIKATPPPLSKITSITSAEKNIENYSAFIIENSKALQDKITLLSPDLAVCSDCIKDMENKAGRRYKYAFTTCTNCGPRFSVIKALPYDRINTTMNKFNMCSFCSSEYISPENRRFHAETNACSICGPQLYIIDNGNTEIISSSPVEFTIKRLKEGSIFAIKGLCGFHLACNGKDSNAIATLRKRKHRPDKPLAVMMKDLVTVKKYCHVNKLEEELLTGNVKPIVILKQKESCSLPINIAPNQNTLGVMLPYTPLHCLLFDEGIEVLIMTSANASSLPVEYENDSAFKNLNYIADYFLMHNRKIENALDDSIVQVISNSIRTLRRARGFVPDPLNFKTCFNIFAYGSHMKNTFSFTSEDFIFTSQHNGNLDNIETIERYKNNAAHFKNIFNFHLMNTVCDLNPHSLSDKLSLKENDGSLTEITVQHHHAHIASCMAENNVVENVIGIAYDGTGYGTDGTIWGGEFLLSNYKSFKRLAHISYVKHPGGDIAVKEPWRMGISYIHQAFLYASKNINSKHSLEKLKEKYSELIINIYGSNGFKLFKLLDNSIASTSFYNTSSIGRFFDAAASIIGIRQNITYEGQAAIELEAILDNSIKEFYNYKIEKAVINTAPVIQGLLQDKVKNVPQSVMSAKFHNSVVHFTVEMCELLRNNTNINNVALSGGVFQNCYISENITYKLEKLKFKVYSQSRFPCNDGGISLGQAVIANELLSAKYANI